MLRHLALGAIAFVIPQFCAFAQTSCYSVGSRTTCSGSSGSSDFNSIGGTVYRHDSDGTVGTYNSIGNTTYERNSDGSSATHRSVGGTTYIQRDDGSSATVRSIGGTTYIQDSDGNTTSCRKIGYQVVCH